MLVTRTFARCDICHRPPGRLAGRAGEHRGRLPAGRGAWARTWSSSTSAGAPTARLVVHHDAHLGRRPGGLATSPRPTCRTTCPRLDDALDACAGMAVNIEIKNDPAEPGFEADRTLADDVAALVRARGETDRVLVSSFDRPSLDRLRAVPIATDRHRVAGHRAPGRGGRRRWWPAATRRSTRGGRPSTSASSSAATRAGLAVNVWTCDDPDAMVRLAAWGVDGICTNVPDVAIAVLAGSDAAARRSSGARAGRRPTAGSSRIQSNLRAVLEAQPSGLAQVVAVDLVREGPSRLDVESARSWCSSTVSVGLDGPAPQGSARVRQERHGPAGCGR